MMAVNCMASLLREDAGTSAVEKATMLCLTGAGLLAAVVGGNLDNATAGLKD